MFTDLKNVVPPTIETMTEAPPQLPAGHPAIRLGEELAGVNTQFDKLLAKLDTQQADFSSEYLKAEKVAINQRRQAELDARLTKFLGEPDGQWGLTGGSIEAQMNDLQAKLDQAIGAAYAADTLDPNKVSLERQSLESFAKTATLAEFQADYETTKNPARKRAHEMFGADNLAGHFRGEPGAGSHIKRMKRNLDANFQNDLTRTIQAKKDELITEAWYVERLTTQLRIRDEGALNSFGGGSNPYQARSQQLLQQMGALDFGGNDG